MEIKPPSHDLYANLARSVSAATQNNLPETTLPNWKVTQLIQAIITKITDKQLFLDIQGVKANTAKPTLPDLKVGDILKLQIEQLKPMPQFRIISLQKATNNQLISQALKSVMSQDTEIAPLLKNISYVANRPALRPSPLAADVNAAVREIYKNLPSPFNLKTAAQLKNHLENSGLFLENKIKNQIVSVIQNIAARKSENTMPLLNSNIKTVLESDLGAQLYRLANIIKSQSLHFQKPAPIQNEINTLKNNNNRPITQQNISRTSIEHASLQNISLREEAMHSFLRQIESSLSHIQQHQLQNLNEAHFGRPVWLLEFPIKGGQHIDLFKLHISEEESNNSEKENKKIWNVTLHFDLTGLGKIKAHIKMQNDFVSALFFSEKKEVLSLFQKNFDFLRSRLNISGLNVGSIECAHAKLTEEISPTRSKPLDEHI